LERHSANERAERAERAGVIRVRKDGVKTGKAQGVAPRKFIYDIQVLHYSWHLDANMSAYFTMHFLTELDCRKRPLSSYRSTYLDRPW